ncbi:hypothetical protein A3A71_03205 [Candidatus Berkelbacteria bacterium RIFCSPLOWO2_01_FULL_50_28]|uniref:ParB/Sulfiredoxin domain-containing protein n=1 Tax=Candidatus Berkelbacteria bacterium RIFCSPLOWO2_01_FULL_50_28 TaxID=1797471 RepID=A0A1F5ECP9_9BACT|nr:MAG: hypothetical protein A2807_02770 [Candidatus Berkelbacteria bacterium RIFCSPHIGHO2_01_FULL_50_36]OGD63797.1 MAG: hypothetical protein A3F39_03605 [Candidatus Berkelbacteria bacterium RIFCSPHIGHO2_12_FULL_50_11]OGD65070.1 MAG: hypothetical protein A3A71_03205 [Candidatus Berkelbacteria bacterium RIFCSPLOWO2_01_FULL_50_28]
MQNAGTIVRGEAGFVDIAKLCIFRQVRDCEGEEYEGIPELADSIASNDLLTPLTVCVWSRKMVLEYKQLVEKIFNGDGGHELENFKPYDGGKYYVLVAGHRRMRSLLLLKAEGSEAYRQAYGEVSGEECFARQFPNGVPARMYQGILPQRGVGLQLEENLNREGVSRPVQAKAIKGLYDLECLEDGAVITVSEFARRLQIKPDMVRDSLKFCDLPRIIQHSVEAGAFKWGCALELTMIQRTLREKPKADGERRTEDEINRILLALSASEAAMKNVAQFKSHLHVWLEEVAGQATMFEELELTADGIAAGVLGQEMFRNALERLAFMRKVRSALNNRWLGDSGIVPLHRPEARKAIGILLEEEEALFSLFQTVIGQLGGERLECLRSKNAAALSIINQIAEGCP